PRTVAPRVSGSRIFGRARRVAGRPGVAVPPPVPEAPPRTAARLARRVPVPPPAPQRPRDPRPPEDARPAQRRPRAPLPRTPRAPGTALPPWTRAPGTALRPWALSPRTALYPGAALRPRDAARQREPPHRDAADPVREGVRLRRRGARLRDGAEHVREQLGRLLDRQAVLGPLAEQPLDDGGQRTRPLGGRVVAQHHGHHGRQRVAPQERGEPLDGHVERRAEGPQVRRLHARHAV